MLFNTAQFGIFLVAVLLLLKLLPDRSRTGLLLAASLLFYTLWTPVYIFLLLSELAVNYALLRAICTGRRPRLALTASVIFTLGLLAFFKYAALIVQTALPVLAMIDWNPAVPDIFLPLGISFFSFQILGLAIDSYRNPGSDAPPPLRYALFISFFPQLIAGPILRGRELLPQLARTPVRTPEQLRRGLWLVAIGLGKKTVLADFLLSPFVDACFGEPGVGNAAFHWMGVLGFSFQVYYDFSGYSDMARGMGLLMGYELPLNFTEPFLSRNPAEMFRRWHITLSLWLRDYLYVGLGGNRKGSARTYLNLFFTMLVCGLWHGAGWTFVIWGALWGIFMSVHRALGGNTRVADDPLRWGDAPRIAGTFFLWNIAVLFFRAESFDGAITFLTSLFAPGGAGGWPVMQMALIVLSAGLHLAERRLRMALPRIHASLATRAWGAPLEATAFGVVIGLAAACSGAGGEFVYFQF